MQFSLLLLGGKGIRFILGANFRNDIEKDKRGNYGTKEFQCKHKCSARLHLIGGKICVKTTNTSPIAKLKEYAATTEMRFRTDREIPRREIMINNRENDKNNTQGIVLTFKPRARNSISRGGRPLALIEGLICRVILVAKNSFASSKTADLKDCFQPENSYSFLDRDK